MCVHMYMHNRNNVHTHTLKKNKENKAGHSLGG